MRLYCIAPGADKAVEIRVLAFCELLPIELGALRLSLRKRFKCRLIFELTPKTQKIFNSASQCCEYIVLEVVHGMVLGIKKKKGGQTSSP